MSHGPKIRSPKKKSRPAPEAPPASPQPEGAPALEGTEEELVAEYKKLDAFLGAVNVKIREEQQKIADAQQQIQVYRDQGLHAVGQGNLLARLLRGRGIDPESLLSEEGFAAPAPPNFPAPEAPKEGEVPEQEEFSPVSALKNRFPRN